MNDEATIDLKGKIPMDGPCRLTRAERRLGETREFRNKRLKSRNRNKMAKASRKQR